MLVSIEVASTWISVGTVIIGTVVSITDTVWVVDAELPEVSVAVHVMIVSPSGNTCGASLVIEAISTRSDTRKPDNSTIFSLKLLASTLRSEGPAISGELVSITEIICWLEIEFP